MGKPGSEIETVRQIFGAALKAARAAQQWQTEQQAQIEVQYQMALQAMEAQQTAAQERAQQEKDRATAQAKQWVDDVKKAVDEGNRLVGQAQLGKVRQAVPYSTPTPVSTSAPQHALQQASAEARQFVQQIRNGLADLERERIARRRRFPGCLLKFWGFTVLLIAGLMLMMR